TYIARMLQLIGWEAPQAAADAVLRFENAIAEVSWALADRRDSEKTYNPTTIAELGQSARFPWDIFLRAARLASLGRIIVGDVTAIPKIAAVYAEPPVDTLKAWQACHVVDSAAPFLSKRFDSAHSDFRRKTLGGETEPAARWKRAVRVTDGAMGEAVGRLCVGRPFPPPAQGADRGPVGPITP